MAVIRSRPVRTVPSTMTARLPSIHSHRRRHRHGARGNAVFAAVEGSDRRLHRVHGDRALRGRPGLRLQRVVLDGGASPAEVRVCRSGTSRRKRRPEVPSPSSRTATPSPSTFPPAPSTWRSPSRGSPPVAPTWIRPPATCRVTATAPSRPRCAPTRLSPSPPARAPCAMWTVSIPDVCAHPTGRATSVKPSAAKHCSRAALPYLVADQVRHDRGRLPRRVGNPERADGAGVTRRHP